MDHLVGGGALHGPAVSAGSPGGAPAGAEREAGVSPWGGPAARVVTCAPPTAAP
ncbi:hypothetical protein [Amycolatopsis sp. NPDC059021]|uniref:hypothetical protein n=1 Tax=Amycolatopsis sp. NPDC059021 TaxID=3346704 RepID=UPI00366D33F4